MAYVRIEPAGRLIKVNYPVMFGVMRNSGFVSLGANCGLN